MDGHPVGTGSPAGGQNPAYRPARHHHPLEQEFWVLASKA